MDAGRVSMTRAPRSKGDLAHTYFAAAAFFWNSAISFV